MTGRVPTEPGSREPSPAVSAASGFDPSRDVVQAELFPIARPTKEQIIAAALEYKPVAIFALFSGGDGSLATAHWAMNNVPGCEVAHFNTGIGLERTRAFVRETCAQQGWPLTEVRALEDCGQSYDEIVLRFGFPGPAGHQLMYRRLKDRCVEHIVRQRKQKRRDKVMLITGICHHDSQRRSGYGGSEINHRGAQMWVNPMYWAGKSWMARYPSEHDLPRNPVSIELGMSGECGCGAYASPGELALWRRIDPSFGERIDALQERAAAAGVPCKWGHAPPKPRDPATPDMFSPMCVGCLKSESTAA